METNKITDCFISRYIKKKSDCLERLASEIENCNLKINNEEWKELITRIKQEKSTHILNGLWHIALCSGPNNEMKELSIAYIREKGYEKRKWAMTYLYKYYPEYVTKLIDDVSLSKDATILFSWAMVLDRIDDSKKMELVLKAYDYADPFHHTLHEGLEYVLTKNGTREHLEYFNTMIKNHPELKEKYKIPAAILEKKFSQ
ncbi:MAG: hypothetical protein JXB88_13325 [Spirochaetales bacterium]|nr:hypothetical protein [Spirochaetales bacterium]